MRWILYRAPASLGFNKSLRQTLPWVRPAAVLGCMLVLGGLAQMAQAPNRSPKPLIVPDANPVPDANDQMEMRQKDIQTHNFNAANEERRRQMMQATEMLETMAIALKAEADKAGPTSQNEVHKAETIERLARIVKERMTISIAPN